MAARDRTPTHPPAGSSDEELEDAFEELTEEEEHQLVMGMFKEVARRLRPDLHAPPAPAIQAGRNDPCPCGSGRKYKRCHGAGDDAG